MPAPRRTRRGLTQALHRHIQLRRLLCRHRQLRQVRRAVHPVHPFQQPPLRRDILRQRHRPHYPRLRCRCLWFALCAAVVGARARLQQGRQLRRRGGDGSGPGLLPAAEHQLSASVQELAQCSAGVVRGAETFAVQDHARMRGLLWSVSLLHGRVRRQRLRLLAGCQQDRGGNRSLRSNHCQRHFPWCREADPARRKAHRGAGDPADGLHPHHADAVREPQQGSRLRPLRLPGQVQRLVALPQRPPKGRGPGAPDQVPLHQARLRRLLPARPRLPLQAVPFRVRRQVDADGVLRRRRRVQLQPHRGVRHPRRDGVRGTGQGGELGRHPPHGGGLQVHRRGMAARPVRGAADTDPGAVIHRHRLISISRELPPWN